MNFAAGNGREGKYCNHDKVQFHTPLAYELKIPQLFSFCKLAVSWEFPCYPFVTSK